MDLMKKSLDFILLDDFASTSLVSKGKKKSTSSVTNFKLRRKSKTKSAIEEKRAERKKLDYAKMDRQIQKYRSSFDEKHKVMYDKILQNELDRINAPKIALAKYKRKSSNVLGPELKKNKSRKKKDAPFFTDDDFKNFEKTMTKPKKKEFSLEDID